jgi:hypothetical protein
MKMKQQNASCESEELLAAFERLPGIEPSAEWESALQARLAAPRPQINLRRPLTLLGLLCLLNGLVLIKMLSGAAASREAGNRQAIAREILVSQNPEHD